MVSWLPFNGGRSREEHAAKKFSEEEERSKFEDANFNSRTAPPVAEWFFAQNWLTGGAKFNPRSADQVVQWLGKPTAAAKVPGSNPGSGMDVKLSVLSPTNGRTVLASKTGRREVTGLIPGRACRPSRSEFSRVFSERRANTG